MDRFRIWKEKFMDIEEISNILELGNSDYTI
jgi:hypothetical protein